MIYRGLCGDLVDCFTSIWRVVGSAVRGSVLFVVGLELGLKHLGGVKP